MSEERALEASASRKAVGRRHSEFFLTLAEKVEPELSRSQQAELLHRLETEHDNLGAPSFTPRDS